MPRLRYRIISVFTLLATLLALLLSGEHLALLTGWWPWRESDGVSRYSHLDKLGHAGMFAACACFMVLGWVTRSFQALVLYLGLLVFGGGTEWLQASIPGRHPDIWDAVANAAGAAAGLAFALLLLRRD